MTKISKSKLNCAIVQGYWTTANSTVQKYKGRGCCQLNCAKLQRSSILQTQLCKSTKVLDAAISTVQSRHFNWYGYGCINCAGIQRSWGTHGVRGTSTTSVCTRLQQLIQEQEWKSINNKIKLLLLVNY